MSEATGKSLRRQKQYYDRNVRGDELQVGDAVRYDNQLSYLNKMFQIVELISDVNVVIVDEAGEKSVVHHNQLKKVPVVREAQTRTSDATDVQVVTRSSQRQRRTPANLKDYDLSTGSAVK